MQSSNETSLPEFKRIQYGFTQHVRNPARHPRPADVDDRRMQIYNELLYNNVEDFMSSGFPVLRSLYSDEKWHRLIRDYFEKHQSSTPLFQEMPREFIKYLETEREAEHDDYPFMLELAHYEWVELALSVSDTEIDMNNIDANGDLLEGVPVLSPLAWVLSYSFAVHRICDEYIPQAPEAQPSFLVVYRNQQDKVHFLELNPVTAQLLQMIEEDGQQTGRQMLQQIATHIQHPNPDVVIQGGLQILHDLRTRDVILGVNK